MTTTENQPGAKGVSGADEWVDVRMTDPEEGEWSVDLVAVDGQISYVDLRVRRSLLASFVSCLLVDLEDATAEQVLAEVSRQRGVETFEDEHESE